MDEQTPGIGWEEAKATWEVFERIRQGGAVVPMAGKWGTVEGLYRCGLGRLQEDAQEYIRGRGDERKALH